MFKMLQRLLRGDKDTRAEDAAIASPAAPTSNAAFDTYKREAISLLVKRSPYLRPDSRETVIAHLNGDAPLPSDAEVLSVQEKKDMGLNTRQKIPRVLTQLLSEEGLACGRPAGVIGSIGLAAHMSATKMEKLRSLRNSQVCSGVRIVACETTGDTPCRWAASRKDKTLVLDDTLEKDRLEHCDQDPYCMGYYEAVIKEL